MTAPLKHWYLIAYDVRDPKRLRKVHYYLRKQALAVQKSVFIVHTDLAQLAVIQDELRARVVERDDDLRLYAIPGPAALWAAGVQAQHLAGLYGGESGAAQPGRLRRWFQGLLGQEAA
ncbi:CRISPR-associated endonuclease Cas2 [uncultured Thiodictyon sp.]|uniref:CRISPR-associated endonuclease Cas2 n=1 Tax=uncultured Thiodictyon sp. TaxID=1846217 RepID=UPI0025F31D7F|nr:CRISPR-associated endonuclease Cas2 [uncultured Thiodictyon sp.]